MNARGSTYAVGPSLVAQASKCLHFYRQEVFGDRAGRLPVSAGQQAELDRGREFERRVISSLAGVAAVEWDRRDWDDGARRTQALLRAGHPWVAGAALVGEGLRGIVDILKRVDGEGGPEDARYVPIEIKNHKAVERADVMQVTGYAVLMESSLGYRPKRGGVFLNTQEISEVWIDSRQIQMFRDLVARMNHVADKGLETEPVRCLACRNCPWLAACSNWWNEHDHISLLPNGGNTTVRKLHEAGIRTVHQLASEGFEALRGRVTMSEKSLRALWLHARARMEGRPIALKPAEFPADRPIYFYDIETFGDEVFLHGAIRTCAGEREERFFFAERPADAGVAWREFLDYMARDSAALVYTWTTYENEHAKACWERFGGNERGYRTLHEGLADQCAWVKEHFVLPVRSYSIKEVAPAFGFHWQAEDAGGTNCEAWYGRWLETGDPRLKEKILIYNRDDVLAMEVIDNELRALRLGEGEEAT